MVMPPPRKVSSCAWSFRPAKTRKKASADSFETRIKCIFLFIVWPAWRMKNTHAATPVTWGITRLGGGRTSSSSLLKKMAAPFSGEGGFVGDDGVGFVVVR